MVLLGDVGIPMQEPHRRLWEEFHPQLGPSETSPVLAAGVLQFSTIVD